MKNLFILALIISNIIHFGLSDKKNKKLNNIKINNAKKSENIEKFLNNSTKKIIKEEENERPTELKRKSNGYWILFLILFSISFLGSGLYVYQDILMEKAGYEPVSIN